MMDKPAPPVTLSSGTPSQVGFDRRRDARRTVQGKATLTVLNGPSAQATHSISMRNVSLGGVCFLLREPLSVGQMCQIQIPSTDVGAGTYLCEVVRSRPLSNGKYEMAVQFRGPPRR